LWPFEGADPNLHTLLFIGFGLTFGLNQFYEPLLFLARQLAAAREMHFHQSPITRHVVEEPDPVLAQLGNTRHDLDRAEARGWVGIEP
jgi:hypothetical protein